VPTNGRRTVTKYLGNITLGGVTEIFSYRPGGPAANHRTDGPRTEWSPEGKCQKSLILSSRELHLPKASLAKRLLDAWSSVLEVKHHTSENLDPNCHFDCRILLTFQWFGSRHHFFAPRISILKLEFPTVSRHVADFRKS